MRSRYKTMASAALLVLLLLAIWLVTPSRAAQHRIGVGFTTASGHFPEPARLVAHQIFVLWVTNTGRSAISLDLPYVLFEDAAGRLVRDNGDSWNEEAYGATLSPGSAAWLASGFDRDDGNRKLKFVFDYHWDGGPLLGGIIKAAGFLHLRMLDGAFHRHYESLWFANPQGGSNGKQPIRSETNATSAAAAPRRSP
jgi:hypothetical protein